MSTSPDHPFSLLAPLLLAATASSAPARAQEWPGFRGPDSTGVSHETGLPDRWSPKQNVAWSVEIAGRAWSSPIVAGDRVFVTSAVSDGEDVEPRKGLYLGGERRDPVPFSHRFTVTCLDFETGEVRWERVAHEGKPKTPIHIKNTYASETPVTDGERVFAYFGNLGLFAYDLDGKKLWERRFEPVRTRFNWGTAASPVYHDGRVYLVNDNDTDSYLLALDAETGDTVWEVERDEKSNWSTPFVWRHDDKTEIVTPGSRRLRSYDLSGELLWELEGMSSITIATPYAADGLLYVTSGYVLDRKKPIYAIRPGATGDISLDGDELSNASIAWCQPRAAPYNPSTLVYDGRLYALLDGGFLQCFDAKTGEQIYKRQRLAAGTGFTVSPWAYDGKIFCLSEDGDTYVVRAGDEFELLHTNPLDEMCMASPAIARGSLLIRTITRLYSIRKSSG
jgi:outer membrane protein assembly factor BamB